mgnify:CR=1 FL=1
MNHTSMTFTDEQLEKFLEDPKNVLQVFMSTFVEKYGYDHNKVKAEILQTKGTHTMWKGKLWKSEQKNTALIGLQHKTFSLILGEGTTDSIEVFMIESKLKNKGVGTRVMEQVLDLADQLGINVTLIPTPYKNVNDEKYCAFLRQWYYDLGFDNSPFSPIMKYNAKK